MKKSEIFQKHFLRRFRCIRFFIVFLYTIAVSNIPLSSFSQANILNVKFDTVSTQSNIELRDFSADFPHPILSLITITDRNNQYIRGLADTSKWLSAMDTTESGFLVDDVWKTILEYHEEDTTIPTNPDVKQTIPTFKVTELLNVRNLDVSVVLVMDYSRSMEPVIEEAEAAARMFIRCMNETDRMSIIKFNNYVEVFQDFTSDTTLLMEAIDRDFPGINTAFYDGIYQAIVQSSSETNRRAIVAYTDGWDTISDHNKNEVISLAQENGILIFTIGLRNNVKQKDVKQIANETGGIYHYVPSIEALASIYVTIYRLIRARYVLAHTSPDPFNNGTWRTIDLTINYEDFEGRGLGKYFVPFLPLNLSVKKLVKTDSISVVNGDTLYIAAGGDTISYELTITNNGPGLAPDVEVVDFPADSIYPVNLNDITGVVNGDSISWLIPRIDEGETVSLKYDARIHSRMSMELVELINTVRIKCALDSQSTDNEDQCSVHAFGLPDLTVRIIPPNITASPGYSLPLSAVLKNPGSADVIHSFRIEFFTEDMNSEFLFSDTVSILNVGDSIQVTGVWLNPEFGFFNIKAMVDADDQIIEMDESNNIDSCTVKVGIDTLVVRASDFSLSDEVRGVNGGFPESVLTYLNVVDQNTRSITGLADTTTWLGVSDLNQFGKIVGDVWQKVLEYHSEDSLNPQNPDVRSSLRLTEMVDNRISVVLALDFSSELAGWSTTIKESLTDFLDLFEENDYGSVVSVNDTIEILQSFTENQALLKTTLDRAFSERGRKFYDGLYTSVNIAQDRSGRNGIVALIGGKDEGSSHTISEVQTISQKKGVPLFILGLGDDVPTESLDNLCQESGGWYFSTANSSDLDKALEITENLFRNYYTLVHTSPDTIQDNTWRTVDVTLSAFDHIGTDTGIYLSPLGALDISVDKEAIGDSLIVSYGDTTWFVDTRDSINYSITVRNIGHKDVQNILLQDVLPSNLTLVSYDKTPTSVNENTIQWSISSIPIGGSDRFNYRCFVDTLLSSDIVKLVNFATIKCDQDTILLNNSDSDTVYYVPLKPADVSVSKQGIGDSLVVSMEDSIWYIYPGDTVLYRISLINTGEIDCENIIVHDILPENVTFLSFLGSAFSHKGDTLEWSFNKLAARSGSKEFLYKCQVDTSMPPWEVPLVNEVTVYCENDTITGNNSAKDTVWVVGIVPPDPRVRVSPSLIEPKDIVQVDVTTPVNVKSWDLMVIFEDGSYIDSYGDEFIQNTELIPNIWTKIIPDFEDTGMRTEQKQEKVGIIFETIDFWDVNRSDTAFFSIRSADEFWLDENTFRPARGKPLGIRFRLSSNRKVEITIYDISGGKIKRVADQYFEAGWNYINWDGLDEKGLQVGSGVYIAVLLSGDFRESHKFILIR